MPFVRKQISAENALIRLQNLCMRSERCESELREKLYQWQVPSVAGEKIMAKLRAERFVDDNRFAQAYAHDKLEFSHWGRRKIQVGLFAKRINRDIIEHALKNIDEDRYLEIMHSVLRSKARTIIEGNTYEGRTKLYRKVITRGFEPDLVAKAIKTTRFLIDPDE